MRFLKDPRKRTLRIAAASVFLVLVILAGSCAVYVGDYYRADQASVEAFSAVNAVSTELLDDNTMVFKPENATKGLIFYPGGKVEYSAYRPLMAACAQKGIFCILVQMPFNLAVLDIHAAQRFPAQYPGIESWYIGGHSLGGSMAAFHLSDRTDAYAGLILLGSYSTADLSESDLTVLSVYGSEDTVLDRVKYDENLQNLPDDVTQVVIDGGCHAYFGMYGEQEGDGLPRISNETQILLTAAHISQLIQPYPSQ